MRIANGLVSLCTAALISLASTADAAPWIDWTMDPRLPDHVANPGGELNASCIVYPDNTTFESLVVRLTTPQGGVLEEWVITDSMEFAIDTWVVPDGYPDGIYRYEMEYYSVENGLTVALSEGYLVAGATTGLCAFKYWDLDNDGEFDGPEDEPLLEDWFICGEPGNPQTLNCQPTNQDGVTCWFFLQPGDYTVCELLSTFDAGEWFPSSDCEELDVGGPDHRCCVDVTVGADAIEKVEFGNTQDPVPTEQKSWGEIKSSYR